MRVFSTHVPRSNENESSVRVDETLQFSFHEYSLRSKHFHENLEHATTKCKPLAV